MSNDLKTIYNSIAEEFSASRVFPWEELQVFIPYIEDNFKVLDLGCGNGRLLKVLQESNKKFDYLGLDFADNLIEAAKKQFPDFSFQVADMESLNLAPQSFDMIFLIASFHHLQTKKARKKVLANIYQALKPDGLLFMTNWDLRQKKYLKNFFNQWWKKRAWNDVFISWQKYLGDKQKLWRYYHSFTEKELESLLLETGFKLEPKGIYKTKWNINCLVKK